MRLLLDENLPRALKALLLPHNASTVHELGWGSIKNGAMVIKADGAFDVLVTADKNLRYQRT
jgi:predicted nuclease of predicted toxin-antitoxin system